MLWAGLLFAWPALSLPPNAEAATITWTGGADGNWFNVTNWSPAQVPTSADDAVIDLTATVSASGATSIAFATLTLGDVAGTFSPTLRLSAAESTSGAVTIHRGATLRQDTNQQIVFGSLNVMPGGKLTHTANSSARSFLINLSVTGDFSLQAGATIAADALGYAGGAGYQAPGSGPGGGGSSGAGDGGGGGHGGRGGQGSSGVPGGLSYDGVTTPADLGSGGGGAYQSTSGGAGGGAVLIAVGGAFSLNGAINAGGGNGAASGQGHASGGGSGGTVNITAAALNGSGQVLANGGTGAANSTRGGGGGGGRISIVVTGSDSSNLNLQASYGNGGGGSATGGGAGVISVRGPGASLYDLTIDASASPQSPTPIPGASLSFAKVTLGNSLAAFDAGSTVTVNALSVKGSANLTAGRLAFAAAGPLEINNGGTLQLTASGISDGSLIVQGGGVFRQMNAVPLGFASITALPGSVITHAANTASRSALLNLNVAGNFDLQAGASIAVNGRGYAGGAGYTAPGSGPGGGGSSGAGDGGGGGHGGAGGRGSSGVLGGASYDNATNPADLGSGGGGAYQSTSGGAGGGAVLIAVGGTFSLNGAINAGGVNGLASNEGHASGGGAGGTVNITAAAFNGSGQILANGGTGAANNTRGGGGGGGRISIVVTGSDSSNLNLQANSGNGGGGAATNGGAGVIAVKTPGGANYNLSIGDLTSVPQSGSGVGGAAPAFSTVTLNNSVVNFDAGSNVTINSLVVAGAAAITGNNFSFGSAAPLIVRPGGSLQVTAGRLTFPAGSPIEVQAGGSLALAVTANSGGVLNVRNGGTFRQLNTQTLDFDAISVERGGVVTHAANTSARTAVLNLNVAGNFDLQAGASIAVSGVGYRGGAGYTAPGSGPGGGASSGSGDGGGGGHGGAGGRGSSGVLGGASYESATNPADLGSGGGGAYQSTPGGAGGGAALITVGGTFSLNGAVNAGGGNGLASNEGHASGGGAGGTVNITAAAFNGSGQILANGGAGASNSTRGGGGGGGRISIVVTGTDSSNLNLQANSGNGGGGAATSGGAGIIAVKTPGGTDYNLSVGDLTAVPQSGTGVVGSPTFSTVTLNNSIVNFEAGSNVTINSLVVAGTAAVTGNNFSFGSVAPLAVRPGGSLQITAGSLTFPVGSPIEVQAGGSLAFAVTSNSGGVLNVRSGGTFRQLNTQLINFDAITVERGGVITHAANVAARTAVLNLNVAGNFDLQAGASIAVNALGYRGGAGYTAPGSGPGGGASSGSGDGGGGGHGGAGGRGSSGVLGGSSYDGVTNPADLGSGGGGAYQSTSGGAGGGAALIAVGGTFSLNGTVNAGGGNGLASNEGHASGGGAGGTVNITAAAFNGSGQVLANGGTGAANSTRGGGGGGGRISIVVTGADSSNLNLQANSGNGGGGASTSGGAGVIAVKGQAIALYHLTIDGGGTPQSPTPIPGASLSFANMTLGNSLAVFDGGSTVTVNALSVKGLANLTAGRLAFAAAGPLEINNGGTLQLTASGVSDGSLIVQGGGVFRQMNALPLAFASVTTLPGGVITHAANTSARTAVLNLIVAGNFDLRAGASIAVNALGYRGGAGYQAPGSGPGGGAASGSGDGGGGGHGGAGGRGSSGVSGGASYDNATNPADLGSGGGGAYQSTSGGSGGGAALIAVGGAFSLNGTINADGGIGLASNEGHASGGGAGGTVNITATAFNGSGQILAKGGSGGSASTRGGGGGGGIVALTGCNSNLVVSGVGGGAAGSGATAGAAGIFSPVVPPACPSAPPPPANLAISSTGEDAAGSTFITATWDPAAQALSYVLQASTASNFTGIVFTATSTATSATVRGLTPDATYFLEVKAFNDIGFSSFSAVVSTLTPVDLTAPEAPILMAASGRPAGVIALSWRASVTGETSAFYNVYRATEDFTSTVAAAPALTRLSTTSASDLPSADGIYFYGVTALDPSGNESPLSNRLSTASIHAPNAPISDLTASFDPAQKQIILNWGAPSTGTPVSYAVYRTTFATSAVAPQHLLQRLNSLTFADRPSLALDAVYFYRVTSLNPVGEESAPSNAASAVFDAHAPVILVAGVVNGQHYRTDRAPTVTVTDFSAFTSTITLNGEPFVGGATVTAPGTYALSTQAQDVFGSTSSAAVSFVIDKSSPILAIVSPSSGALLSQDTAVVFTTTDDFTSADQLVVRNQAGQPPPYSITAEGIQTLTLTAADLAGNAGTAAIAVTLDKTAPQAVTDLRVTDQRPGEMDLAWTAPSDNVSGVTAYDLRTATFTITAANFYAAQPAASPAPQAAGTTVNATVLADTSVTRFFVVRSTDAAGHTSALSNVAFLDRDGPALTGLSLAFGSLVSRPATLSVQAADLSGVDRVVFYLDGSAVSTRTASPYSFAWNTLAFADGEHSLVIRAYDAAGRESVLSGLYNLLYAPPAAPTITSPASGFATFSATVTVTGTAEPGTTAQVRLGGVAGATALAASNGTYSVNAVLPVEGDYQLTVVAKDAKGQSNPSAPITVFFNLAPPNPPRDFSAETRTAGRVRLAWAAPLGKTPTSYRLYRSASDTALSSGTTPGSGLRVASGVTATAFEDLPPSDGTFYYGATSLDSSGNESGLSEVSAGLSDRAAPSAAVALAASVVGPGQHPLTLTLTEPVASVPILLFAANGAGPQALALSPLSTTVWTGTLTVTAATNPGAASFQFQGTDFAGNAGTTLTSGRSLTVDNRGPVGAITLYPFPPLPAGNADLALILDEAAASTPTLSFVTARGSTVTVPLEAAGTAGTTWVGTVAVPSGQDGIALFVYSATDTLGNLGTTLSARESFAVDTTPPGAPLSLGAASRPAGVVRLTWSGPIGEPAAAYRVYRDSAALAGTVAPQGDQTGRFDDSPAEGAHVYQVAALDAAGNEGAPSNLAAGLSDAVPPAAPTGASAVINAFGRVELSWNALAGETYRIYRTTYAPASLASLSFVFVSTSPLIDTPPQNGLIRYSLTAVDGAGNVSTAAATATVFYDRAPPVVTVTGIAEGGLYNHPVFPAFSASDPALDTATVQGKLDGVNFVSGSVVATEGEHTFVVSAANLGGVTSTVTVHFALDLSSPSISVTGVAAGQTYHAAVIPIVNVTDPRLASVAVTLDGEAYTAGVPISADGARSLVVTARDQAGNVASSTTTFTLDLPPLAPPSFTVAIEEGLGASLSWQSPGGDTAGYRAFRDGTPLHQGLLAEPRLSDPSYALGLARVYEVAAVDAAGQEGTRARASIPAVTAELESFGTIENGAPALTRGFFDAIRLRLANASAASKLVGPTTFELIGGVAASGQAASVSVPAGGQAVAEGVVGVPVALPASASVRATVKLPVELGSQATMRRTFSVASRAPREPILEAFPEALVRGTNKNVRVKVNNQGSAPLELLSAVPSNLLVELRTPEGTTLSSARLSQSGNGAQPSPSGYFVSVPGGSSVLLDPVSIFVPDALGASAQLRVRLERVFNGLVSGAITGPRDFETVKTLSGVSAPPYTASVSPQRGLYDQGSSVILLGEARDDQAQLVPGATVQIGVSVRGFERVASTRTDETGRYQLTFSPAPAESGQYTLWAAHPEVVDRAPQSSFTIVGLAWQFSDYTATLTQNAAVPFRVNLSNIGQSRIEGLSAVVISSSVLAGATLTLDPTSLPAALDAGQSASVSLTASATAAAALGRSRFVVRVTESHGFTRDLPVNADVAASAPTPSIEPTGFNIGMSAGQTRTLEVRLKNAGARAWEGVFATAPTLPWVRVQGSSTLGDVPPGGAKSLFLVLEPPASLPSQAFAANPLVELRSSNATTIPVNALITLTASGLGNVAYTVINADKPRNQFGAGEGVSTAEVTLVSLDVSGLSFRATADSNGVVRLLNAPAGRYSYTAKAAGFEDASGVESIEPGVTLQKELLLLTNVVSYEWTVEPTTIQDQYNIQLGITFKTDVPAPAVSISPAVMNFNLDGGQSADAQLTVENKGLVSAFDVDLLPENVDPAIVIDMPYNKIRELKAGEKLIVPFRITLIHASCHSAKLGADYGYTCAAGTGVRKKAPPVNISAGHCFNIPTTTVGEAGGGGFSAPPTSAGGSGGSGISLSVPSSYMSFAIPNPPTPPAPPNSCRPPSEKYPSECTTCDQLGAYSDPGGDPRVPESDLSIAVPKFGGSLDFTRVYDSQDFDASVMGRAWTHSFDSRVRLTRAGTVFFRDREADFASTADYASSGGASARFELASDTRLFLNADWLAEMRTPSGRRLLYRHTGGTGFSGPPGEPSTLTLQGSTAAPTGFLWTLPDKTVYAYDAAGKLLSIKDRNDNQVTLVYSGGLLTAIKDPDNRTLYTLSYTSGKLTGVTDLAGRSLTFSYDGSGYLSQSQGPKGTVSYGYTAYDVPELDAANFANGIFEGYKTLRLLTSITAPNGHVTSFTYGPPGKRVDYELMELYLTGGDGRSFTTGNAGFGVVPIREGRVSPPTSKSYYTPLLASGTGYVVDTEGFARWYFPQRFFTLSESGPLGSYSFQHTVDELLEGGSTVITDPRGYKETRYWENKRGRPQTGIVQDAAGGERKTAYDSGLNPAQITDRAGNLTTVAYDSSGYPNRITSPLSQSTVFAYEPAHNKLALVTEPKGNQTHFSYDQDGNLSEISDAEGNNVSIGYSNGLFTNVNGPLGYSLTFARNPIGLPTSMTDPLGHATQMTYDALGRLASITDAAGKTTSFQRDPSGEVVEVTDALSGNTNYDYLAGPLTIGRLLDKIHDAKGQTTSFGYDSRGRLTSIRNPLNETRSFEYDAANHLTKVTRANGAVVTLEYDNLGRLSRKTLPGDAVTYSFDANGNVILAEDSDSKVQLIYDALNRPTRSIQTNKAASFVTQLDYEYDANNNRSKMTLAANPSALVWTYAYDGLNRLISITNPRNGITTFQYDALSRKTRSTSPNGLETIYSYDQASNLLSITTKRISTSLIISSVTYTYSTVGKKATMTNWAGQHSYSYDDVYRLTGAQHPPASVLPTLNESFSYDSVGNRLADSAGTYSYNAANRLVEDSFNTYSYDATGNLISTTDKASGRITQYTYDGNGLRTHASIPDGRTADYRYDAFGRRIEKTISSSTIRTTRYIYDGSNILGEVDADGTSIYTYELKPDQPLSLMRGATEYFFHADGIGSIIAITDSLGDPISRMEYSAFGLPSTFSAVGTPFAFTGREYDAETGAYYFRSRYFNPKAGRFEQEDRLGTHGGDTNSYAYVANNPINFVDPFGFARCVYSISLHTMYCVANDGSKISTLGPDGLLSGYEEGKCINNPSGECVNSMDDGPVVPGNYDLVKDPRTDPKHKDWYRLEPVYESFWQRLIYPKLVSARLRRGLFRFHKGYRSLGCITARADNERASQEFDDIINMLDAEQGRNNITVVSDYLTYP